MGTVPFSKRNRPYFKILATSASISTTTAEYKKDKNYNPAAVITKTESAAASTSIFWHNYSPPFYKKLNFKYISSN